MPLSKMQEELQSLTPSGVVEMFELDLTIHGGSVFRFCAKSNELSGDVVWQGESYIRMPIDASGFDKSSSGSLPRPAMQIGNASGALGLLAKQYGYFLRCKVTRKRTFVRFLDSANFAEPNLEADPNQHFLDEVWFVDRKANENPQIMEFELASVLDMMGVNLPRRQIVQNCCSWVYRSSECGYTGNPVATVTGAPTSDPALDRCGQRLSDCKLRFGTAESLPFGGFPAVGLIR